MIVNWTKTNMKVIPAQEQAANDYTAPARFVTLAPGYNDVPNEKWAIARKFVQDQLIAGLLVEEWRKVPRPDEEKDFPVLWMECEDKRDTKSIMIPCEIKEIYKPRVIDGVVRNTFHVPSLKKWLVEDSRADVVKEMVSQIDKIERGEIVG